MNRSYIDIDMSILWQTSGRRHITAPLIIFPPHFPYFIYLTHGQQFQESTLR